MAKVSVIIPVYGVESIIERCAVSLFEQTLDDIEYIFINDATKDKSIEVLKSVISKYPHRKHGIRIIDLEANKGQAYVRTLGIQLATGEYIIHCDSDDWTDTSMYERMYNLAQEEGSDCVICDYIVSDGKNNLRVCCESVSKDLFDDLMSYRISTALWNKLYKRSLYKKELFYEPKGNVGEDTIINLNLAYGVKKVSHLKAPLYYYYENQSSIIRASDKISVIKRYNESQKNVTVLRNLLHTKELESKYKDEIVSLLALKREWLGPLLKDDDIYTLWKNSYPEVNSRLLMSPRISIKRKVKYLLHLLRIQI